MPRENFVLRYRKQRCRPVVGVVEEAVVLGVETEASRERERERERKTKASGRLTHHSSAVPLV